MYHRVFGAFITLPVLVFTSLPALAEEKCSLASHVASLHSAGWTVEREDVACAVDLAPQFLKLMKDKSSSSKPFSFEYKLIEQGAGPICASLAFQRIKQGCEGESHLTKAATSADEYINAILGGGDTGTVTGTLEEGAVEVSAKK